MATKKSGGKKKKNFKVARKRLQRKAKTTSKATRISSAGTQIAEAERPSSYEHAVIKNILSSSGKGSVPDEAVMFNSTLTNLSSGLRDLHYKSGMSIGKALYASASATKDYTLPEESVQDLVLFLEAVGYRHVTYRAFPDKVDISIHNSSAPALGAKMHSFEAGIIAGFMSAATHKLVSVQEYSCANKDGVTCRFTTGAYSRQTEAVVDTDLLDKFADHLVDKASSGSYYPSLTTDTGISKGYHSLSSQLLFDKSYLESVKSIALYLGSVVNTKLSGSASSDASHAVNIARAIKMLNFGHPMILGINPLHIEVSFDELSSKREFVDVSLSFINGLLSGKGSGLEVTQRNEDGSYIIDIRESRPRMV